MKNLESHQRNLSLIDEVNDIQLEDEESAVASTMAAAELNFLFINSRSRSGRLVKTSSKVVLWM